LIEELCPIPQPRLSWLNLSSNRIKSAADFTGHDELRTLLMSENKLADCSGLSAMPKLVELNLNGNRLTSLTQLRGLGSLKKLEVARNRMADLEAFPCLPELEHFDASENKIEANGEK
jgi:Leucine-rich repeat (LRR) protein